MLTIKSDDVEGRADAFNAIIKGYKIKQKGIPASFNVLINYLRGLTLDVSLHTLKENNLMNNTYDKDDDGVEEFASGEVINEFNEE